MFILRFFGYVFLILLAVVGFTWYSAQTLPDWYGSDETKRAEKQLVDRIGQQGVGNFLGSKINEVLAGELILSESEFNALMIASLQSSRDGRRVLEVTEAVNAKLMNDRLEVAAIVNLDKLSRIDAKTKRAVKKVRSALPLLRGSRVAIAVEGEPVARRGQIGFNRDISLKIGSVPVPASLLEQLGAPMERVEHETIPIKYLTIKSVKLSDQQIRLGVEPRF